MNQNQAAGLLGSALLFSGLFAPIFSSPVKGQFDYFDYNTLEATILLCLAALSLTLSLLQNFQYLPLVGIGSGATLALAFIKYQLFVTGSDSRWMGKFADSSYEGINRLIQSTFALDWGWGLLISGAVLISASGRIRGYDRKM